VRERLPKPVCCFRIRTNHCKTSHVFRRHISHGTALLHRRAQLVLVYKHVQVPVVTTCSSIMSGRAFNSLGFLPTWYSNLLEPTSTTPHVILDTSSSLNNVCIAHMKPTHAHLRVSGPPGARCISPPRTASYDRILRGASLPRYVDPYAYPYTHTLGYFWAAESIPGLRTGVS
jgi:hypothetical protein